MTHLLHALVEVLRLDYISDKMKADANAMIVSRCPSLHVLPFT